MAALLQSLASRKFTIAWFFLLSACFFLSLGGDQAKQSWLASVGLQTNEPLRSLPMLILFGILALHLLLKPLASLVGRKKKTPVDDDSEEDASSSVLLEQKRQSLYSSVSLAEVKTLIPYANLRAFLHFFRIELPPDNENGEVLRTTYGSPRVVFLLFAVLGCLCLGTSLLYRHGLFPAASMTLFSNVQKTQTTHPAPFKQWLHQKTSLWNQEPMDWGTPTQIRLAFAQKQERVRIVTKLAPQREARLEARWRTVRDGKALEEKQLQRKALETQSVGLQLPIQGTRTTLRLGQQKRIGTLLWTFVKQSNQLSIKVGEETHVLEQGLPKVISAHRVMFQGVEIEGARPTIWLLVSKEKKRKRIGLSLEDPLLSTASFRWIGSPRTLKLSEQLSITFVGLDFGAELRYQPIHGAYLGWLGLFLFLFGFLGAWWQIRYRVEVLWGGDTGLVRIEGSGLAEQGKRITHVLQEALYFPIDWVTGPASSKRSAGNEPSRNPSRTSTQTSSASVASNTARPTSTQIASAPTASNAPRTALSQDTRTTENTAGAIPKNVGNVGTARTLSSQVASQQTVLPPVPTPPLFVNEPPPPESSPRSPSALMPPASPNKTTVPTPPAKEAPIASPPSGKTPSPAATSPKTVPSAPATVPSAQKPVPTEHSVGTPLVAQTPISPTKPPATPPSKPPPVSQHTEPPVGKERRSTTDEFAAPFAAPSTSPAPSKEEAFTEATAVSHRPDLLQQVRQSSPREASDIRRTKQDQKTPSVVDSRSLIQPQAPISFSPSSSSVPSTQKPLDMDALFGDILKEAPSGKPKEAAKAVEDDIDALFAQISTPKKP